ncbi:MAG: AtpZ/AtpI family protein [Armatimonadetes bacterium]|nr:AtpZ/AtpI family protein [Armatimonadota bacterium]MDE2205913.1 AtpZ/AtpI family protein [Armatimonadota bacterium]
MEKPDDKLAEEKKAWDVAPDAPIVPKFTVSLPPRPVEPETLAAGQRQASNTALALSAVSAFVAPIIVLVVAGWLLDLKLRHTTYWFSLLGAVLGLVVGISSLVRTLQKLNS